MFIYCNGRPTEMMTLRGNMLRATLMDNEQNMNKGNGKDVLGSL